MKADTFRARLRLGLGFDGPVHVPEDLTVCDRNIAHLCDAICVDGKLDLSGCTNLERLPERLVVRGHLKIADCAKITQLPETIRELFGFTAAGCSSLASIEPLDQCRGPLDLRGCATIGPLPSDFMAVDIVKLEGLRIDNDSIFLKRQLPDTVQRSAIGKRIGDVVRHRVLGDHPVLEAVITDVLEMEKWGGVIFHADTSKLIIPGKPD